ncbi:MAG: DNA mismatch repair protein MutS [Verrucomicrobiales bacterium]|jgi:DNA mismatch repair protein MutS|nr:DNA mismatch repair protein MutS [Verrucomicrobiales bacterium]
MSETLTPMMQQYRQIKGEIPRDALLLFRLGDFYEMFFDDAKETSALLNLTLTKRHGVPMCGIPYHAAENYVGKLIQHGKRVAICDQVTEPRPGQIVERKVTQILSPGSTFNLELTQPKENRFIAAVLAADTQFGFAFLDMTTGEFRATELGSQREWLDEMQRLRPKELIYPAGSSAPELNGGTGVALYEHDEWTFERGNADLELKEHFNIHSLDGFGCAHLDAGLSAAGALLHYVTKELKANAAHVLKIQPYSGAEFLVVDAITQRNLELTVSASSNAAADTSLLKVMDQTVTAMAGRELRRWILQPLRMKDAIEARQLVVARWLEDVGQLEAFREQLREVRDLERLIGRLAQGSGNARDLQGLRQSLAALPAIASRVAALDTPLTLELSKKIQPLPEVVELIASAIVEDPPLQLKEGGLIREGYRADVDELRHAQREGKNWVAELQAREQERTGIKSLKVRFNSVFGYYIEITKSNLAQTPADYTRKQTLVNAERFITPELKEMEGKILGAEERAKQLEYQIFQEVRAQVTVHTAAIQESARAIAQLDILAGFALSARLFNYSKPVISGNGRLEIIEGRHPVLEQLIRGERFVPNDTTLNDDDCRLAILTGPNMAGKSTYIRQVALIALMAHTGSYVPAQKAVIPMLDRIFTRVGASDDLSRGQSTFMVEMNETANILNNATADSLVILDEIGRGTSTFDGLSIAWAVAEHLHNIVRAKTLFATHYHELTELSMLLRGAKNYNVVVREWHDQIIFLRKIAPGGTDKSYGIQVARLAGLPKEVVSRAKEILRNLEEAELDTTGQPNLAHHRQRTEGRPKSPAGDIPQLDLFKLQAAKR